MRRSSIAALCFAFSFVFTMPATLSAQTAKPRIKPPPQPRKVALATKDGVELSGFYFPSNKEKEAIPVLVVHEWKGQKALYGPLYLALRNAGCAVLTLDYRGHGGSREYVDRSGRTQEFDLKTMNKRDVASIVTDDLDAAKKFLEQENNEGKLNLNALVVIGIRDGSVLAAGWSQRDWSFGTIGTKKQGQDVKALVLVSPKRLLKGISIENSLAALVSLPTMVVYGSGSEEETDSLRIYKRIEAGKKRLSSSKNPEGLNLLEVKQPLGGASLLTGPANVIPEIVKFVTTEVKVGDLDNPWIERQ